MTYFTVRSTSDDKAHESFATREAAKQLRNKLNGGKWSDEKASREFVVSRTTEHRHGASGSIPVKRTQSQKKRK